MTKKKKTQSIFEQRSQTIKGCNGRIPDIPALRHREIVSTDRDFGPSVPTIFVMAGKKVCRMHFKIQTLQSKSNLTNTENLHE